MPSRALRALPGTLACHVWLSPACASSRQQVEATVLCHRECCGVTAHARPGMCAARQDYSWTMRHRFLDTNPLRTDTCQCSSWASGLGSARALTGFPRQGHHS